MAAFATVSVSSQARGSVLLIQQGREVNTAMFTADSAASARAKNRPEMSFWRRSSAAVIFAFRFSSISCNFCAFFSASSLAYGKSTMRR